TVTVRGQRARTVDGEGGRRGKSRRSAAAGVKQLPWRQPVNRYAALEVLSADALEAIHDASMRILENHGLEFLSPRALDILAANGAEVDRATNRVRFDRALVLEWGAKAPRQFTLHARNPPHDIVIGGEHVAFCAVSSAPNVSDLDNGRRPGNYADFANLLRLVQSFNVIHLASGYPVEPIDLPPPTRHLDAYYAFITLTDKVWQ